jgi:hypothetical protein
VTGQIITSRNYLIFLAKIFLVVMPSVVFMIAGCFKVAKDFHTGPEVLKFFLLPVAAIALFLLAANYLKAEIQWIQKNRGKHR